MNRPLIIIAIICAGLFLSGCNKLFDGGGHYTLSGTLIDSCGGQRVPNRPLVVIYSAMTYPHPVTNKVIGKGQADASGYFRIRCEHVNSGNITLIDTLTGYKYFVIGAPPSDDTERSLGFVYTDHGTYKATVNIKVSGSFLSSDTLFVGTPFNEYKIYFPVKPDTIYYDQIFRYTDNPAIFKRIEHGLTWGVGYTDFISSYKQVSAAFNICDYPDTTTSVTINHP